MRQIRDICLIGKRSQQSFSGRVTTMVGAGDASARSVSQTPRRQRIQNLELAASGAISLGAADLKHDGASRADHVYIGITEPFDRRLATARADS
jgi:hypothetical protein